MGPQDMNHIERGPSIASTVIYLNDASYKYYWIAGSYKDFFFSFWFPLVNTMWIKDKPWKEKVISYDRWPLKRGSIHMKCLMTGQEKGDLLIQVTAQ